MKKIIKLSIIIIIFISLFIFLNYLLAPKYKTDLIEGRLTSDYYQSSMNHDVIILGDCEVYENISPLQMYKETGVKSFVRGNSQQLIWQSYYLLEETLNYEKPKVVILSVNALRNGDSMINEAYNRLIIDKMKWSKEKVDMINTSKKKDETFLSYVFPILRYHTRITELKEEDFKYLFDNTTNSYNGFLINKGVKPVGKLPTKKILANYNFEDKVIEYLDKITEECKKNNIELILLKAPSLYPYWYDEYDEYVTNYADKNNLTYINTLNYIDEIGLDYNYDTYDAGLHLNLNGATKLSKYLANRLKDDYLIYGDKDDLYFNELLKEYEKDA